MSASSLEGRVAIVTAPAGAAVAAVDIKRDKAERMAESVSRNGARCVALETDVSDRSSVEGMVERVAGELGVWTSW